MPSFDATGPVDVTVEIMYGHIRVHASDRDDVVVNVQPSDPDNEPSVQIAERLQVTFSDGRLLVKDPRNKGVSSLFGGRGSVDITIETPRGSGLRIKGAVAVEATGELGDTTVNSSHGEIRLEHTGQLDARTPTGEIVVGLVTGRADISATTGSVSIGTLEEPVTIKSSTGDITIGTAAADLTARSAHGRIRVDRVARGATRLETGSSKIHIGIADGTAAWLDLHTKKGVVRNSLTPSEQPGEPSESVEVRAHSNYGDIEIFRS